MTTDAQKRALNQQAEAVGRLDAEIAAISGRLDDLRRHLHGLRLAAHQAGIDLPTVAAGSLAEIAERIADLGGVRAVIVDVDEDFAYCVQPGRRGICRVSLATGRAQLLRPRRRKERTEMITDDEWRRAAPAIAASLRRAAAAEDPDEGFAPVPPPAWAGPATGGGPMTAAERRVPGLLFEGDYHPIPAGLWDRKP